MSATPLGADDLQRRAQVATLGLVVVVGLLHLWLGQQTGFGDSEAYYTAWSLRPQLSYYDHPPLLAWGLALTTSLFGVNTFGVRILPAVLVSAVAYGVSRLDREGDPRGNFWAAALLLATPAFSIGGIMASPEIPLVAAWIIALMLARRVIRSPTAWGWLLCGVVLGVAFLAKYTALCLVPAMWVAARRVNGATLHRQPMFWAAGGVALVCVSPVLIWNIQSGFPSLTYHLWQRHGGIPFHPKNAAALLGGQLGYLSPVIAALLAWTYLKYRARMNNGTATEEEKLLGAFVAPVLIPLYILCLATDEAEPHWPMMGYLPLYALSGRYLMDAGSALRARWLKWSFGVALTLQSLFFFHTLTPVIVEQLPASYEPKYDIVNELYGWRQVIDSFEARLPPGLSVRWAGAHYVMCGQIAAGLKDLDRAACVSPKRDAFDDLLDPIEVGEWILFVSDNRYTTPVTELVSCSQTRALEEVVVYRGERAVRWFQGTLCLVEAAAAE